MYCKLQFLNLPNDNIKTYLKLDDDKSFFNKFLDDKKNFLWILGLKQSRVLVYSYFDFKSLFELFHCFEWIQGMNIIQNPVGDAPK